MTEAPDDIKAFDYYDDMGSKYDQMGNSAMIPRWVKEKHRFFAQIDRHLLFKADFTIIDLTEFPTHIIDDVIDYILKLPEE